jgi:hypothetical protein
VSSPGISSATRINSPVQGSAVRTSTSAPRVSSAGPSTSIRSAPSSPIMPVASSGPVLSSPLMSVGPTYSTGPSIASGYSTGHSLPPGPVQYASGPTPPMEISSMSLTGNLLSPISAKPGINSRINYAPEPIIVPSGLSVPSYPIDSIGTTAVAPEVISYEECQNEDIYYAMPPEKREKCYKEPKSSPSVFSPLIADQLSKDFEPPKTTDSTQSKSAPSRSDSASDKPDEKTTRSSEKELKAVADLLQNFQKAIKTTSSSSSPQQSQQQPSQSYPSMQPSQISQPVQPQAQTQAQSLSAQSVEQQPQAQSQARTQSAQPQAQTQYPQPQSQTQTQTLQNQASKEKCRLNPISYRVDHNAKESATSNNPYYASSSSGISGSSPSSISSSGSSYVVDSNGQNVMYYGTNPNVQEMKKETGQPISSENSYQSHLYTSQPSQVNQPQEAVFTQYDVDNQGQVKQGYGSTGGTSYSFDGGSPGTSTNQQNSGTTYNSLDGGSRGTTYNNQPNGSTNYNSQPSSGSTQYQSGSQNLDYTYGY